MPERRIYFDCRVTVNLVLHIFRFRIIQPPKKPKIPELPKERNRGRDDDSASMPPPPSPASSTCSDGSLSNPAGGPVPSPAPSWRQKRSAPREEERIDEEEWPLQEVIFVEDSKNIPVGKSDIIIDSSIDI